MTDATVGLEGTTGWLQQDLRKVAAAATAGLVCGFVVNGVGSRLAMMLLARLNPQVTGRISDDGFRMGQFTLADTAGLVLFGTAVGVLGGLVFLTLRSLRFGPGWFRTTSMTVGPAVVVGSMLIHDDGIDFRVLEPVWLAIGLFLALPAIFAASVSWLTDRWTGGGAWAMRRGRGWWFGLSPLVVAGPALLVVIAAFGLRAVRQEAPALRSATATPWFAGMARLALVVVFLAALRDLGQTILALT